MTDAKSDGTSAPDGAAAGSALWTMFLDDGTTQGVRVECTAERIGEFILSRRAGPMTNAIAPGSTARVPLAALALFAPFFNADDRRHALEMSGRVAEALDPSLHEALEGQVAARRDGRRVGRRVVTLRLLSLSCIACGCIFHLTGLIVAYAVFAKDLRITGVPAGVSQSLLLFLMFSLLLALPLAFVALACILDGVGSLLDAMKRRRADAG